MTASIKSILFLIACTISSFAFSLDTVCLSEDWDASYMPAQIDPDSVDFQVEGTCDSVMVYLLKYGSLLFTVPMPAATAVKEDNCNLDVVSLLGPLLGITFDSTINVCEALPIRSPHQRISGLTNGISVSQGGSHLNFTIAPEYTEGSFQILSANGKMVQNWSINNAQNRTIRWNMSDAANVQVSSGRYIALFTNNNTSTATTFVIP